MSLFIASLNSGSNGNCYFIGNRDTSILVDCGISCREIEKRLKRLGLSVRKVKAIFISHEHGDHIHGLPVFSKKFQIPVFITPATLKQSGLTLNDELVHSFTSNEPIVVGDLVITAFPKLHDACEPHSFIVSDQTVSVGVFTDIGEPCHHVKAQFQKCHAAFLESNYDDLMLTHGNYPYPLKERVRSSLGHLSNAQAIELFTKHRPPYMSHLLLSHLSRNNNTPQLVQSMFEEVAGKTEIIIAPRHKETILYHIKNNLQVGLGTKRKRAGTYRNEFQLSLFN